LTDIRTFRRFLPTGRKAWLVAIVIACIVGAVVFLHPDSSTAAVTYVLF
jgi:hypothetical protein